MKILILIILIINPAVAMSQAITGTVFRDFNANGVKDNNTTYQEPGLGGITITVFNAAGTQQGTAISCRGANDPTAICTSSNIGYYEIAAPNGSYRIEFSWAATHLYSGAAGGTSVQFVTAPASNVNFGINNPSHYSQPAIEQELVTPRFVYGYYNSSSFGSTPAIIGIPYNAQDPTSNIGIQNPAVIASTAYALFNQVGTTMGLAWQRTTSNLYTGAFMHRHSGFGPAGTGGIYIVNKDLPINDPNKVKVYADLNAIFGANTAGADPHPQTEGGNWFNDVRDPANTASWVDSWNTVGKIALGDVEISEDESTLYVVNLADRQLYVLPADPALAGSLTPAQIQRYPIPLNWCVDNTASNTTDDSRPFALKYYDGKLYVGVTCTAESIGAYNVADVGVAIYEFTGSSFSAQPVFTIDGVNFTSPQGGAILFSWTPWVWGTSGTGFNPNALRQFWLTDIEVDNGDLQLGVRDRWGDLVHFNAGLPTPSNAGLTPANNVQATTMGKSFRACLDRHDTDSDGNRNEWILESGGQCGGVSGAGHPTAVAWTPGPGGSVFYHEYASHAYPGLGGLVQLPGFLEMAETTMGPTGLNSGGINWMNNFGTTAGQNTRGGVATPVGATLYDGISTWPGGTPSNPNPWFKSAGLGDVEAFSDPAPIEIGNRIWLDMDNDGIQDADEVGISGVQVQLVKGGSTLSTVTTDTNGNYLFSSATGTDATGKDYGITQLEPNMAYTVRFPTTTTVAATTYNLTTAAAGSNRLIDSNAPANGEVTVLATDIPVAGANNHSFDVGYSSAPVCSINTPTIAPTCNDNGTSSNPADDTFTFTISATGTGVGANY
ncbi:MAG: hypothetical protein JNN12_06200, partial [Bacteroidetes Order II. Incertae sedis bacterium]|nr:hypothetical protein [Bacteroidetes Order II. bacterium]